MARLIVAQGQHGVNKLHVPAGRDAGASALVVFFIGDRIESVGCDPDVLALQEPATLLTQVLCAKFPGCTVAVVTPSRFEACCAAYDHFLVSCTLTGEPLGYPGASFKASSQLLSLLHHAGLLPSPPAPLPSIHLVGFSKGGVVLNQLLAELAALVELQGAGEAALPASARLLRSLRHVHYLDVGLNCRGAYTTDPRVIQSLGRWCKAAPGRLHLFLHGTPRQWDDPRRPVLGEEKARMAALCLQEGVPLREVKYFEGQPPSLKMHFDVIRHFETTLG